MTRSTLELAGVRVAVEVHRLQVPHLVAAQSVGVGNLEHHRIAEGRQLALTAEVGGRPTSSSARSKNACSSTRVNARFTGFCSLVWACRAEIHLARMSSEFPLTQHIPAIGRVHEAGAEHPERVLIGPGRRLAASETAAAPQGPGPRE